jgi:3-phenylpropionate/trans-cinnamate dioxygenase ferredoxin subunit
MAEWIKVAAIGEIAPGERKLFDIDGEPAALFNRDGEYYAIADVCTHDDGPVAEGVLDGFEIECPRHGARFDIRSGAVLSFPAIVPIPTYEVRVEEDGIYVARP